LISGVVVQDVVNDREITAVGFIEVILSDWAVCSAVFIQSTSTNALYIDVAFCAGTLVRPLGI
jgi:hypothetical protein